MEQSSCTLNGTVIYSIISKEIHNSWYVILYAYAAFHKYVLLLFQNGNTSLTIFYIMSEDKQIVGESKD